MRLSNTSFLSWVILAVAVCVWGGVAYFVSVIFSEESAHALKTADAQLESEQQAAMIRLHALARETKNDRESLAEIARADAIEIVQTIEAAGRDAAIPIEIGQALTAPSRGTVSSLHSIDFIVDMEGTFSAVLHAISLLESLSIPSLISDMQFEQVPAMPNASKKSSAHRWRAVVHMRFLTTVEV